MKRIIVVDDDRQMMELMSQILTKSGYQVASASSWKEALALQRDAPADLVITDIVMPEQDGISLIMSLTREFPTTKIIAVSGGGAFVSKQRCLEAAQGFGAARVIAKPFEQKEFLDVVKEVMAE